MNNTNIAGHCVHIKVLLFRTKMLLKKKLMDLFTTTINIQEITEVYS